MHPFQLAYGATAKQEILLAMEDLSYLLQEVGSSRTGLVLEDSSKTNFGGLGLGLQEALPWPWLEAMAWSACLCVEYTDEPNTSNTDSLY